MANFLLPEAEEERKRLSESLSDAILTCLGSLGYDERLTEPKGNIGLKGFVKHSTDHLSYDLLRDYIGK